jgi:CcmD family protein
MRLSTILRAAAVAALLAAAPAAAQDGAAPASAPAADAPSAASASPPAYDAAAAATQAPAVTGLPPRPQTMRPYWHVFVAYALVWLLLFGYVVALGRRFGRLEAEVQAARA